MEVKETVFGRKKEKNTMHIPDSRTRRRYI